MEPESLPKRGYTIDEVVSLGLLGRRSNIYKLINSGALKAHKVGKRTVILAPDLDATVSALPAIKPKNAA